MLKSGLNVTVLPTSNIIQVGQKRQTAKLIENFYKKNPFPNYENFEGINDIEKKLKKHKFSLSFKKSVGFGKKIIEVGSGTCQLSIALAIRTNNEIVAFDATLESLQLGAAFADKNGVENCCFVNGDLISDPFIENYFDVVWCSGVLHHTENAEKGFKTIAKWLKLNGYIVIGLYNLYGRMRTVFRQVLYKSLGKSTIGKLLVSVLDPELRKRKSKARKEAWFKDQYENPVESLHTADEVLRWFDENGIEFISSVPSCHTDSIDYENIFSKKSRGSRFTRFLSQVFMSFASLDEGGLFLMIGRKTH